MEKQKLKLDDLKVQSFVTSFDKELDQTRDIQGGLLITVIPIGTVGLVSICASCSWCK